MDCSLCGAPDATYASELSDEMLCMDPEACLVRFEKQMLMDPSYMAEHADDEREFAGEF